MKKVMMMALMAAAATTAFAQETVVKEAKKLLTKKDFDAAAQMLTPALTSSETLDKAAAWNLMTDIQFEKFSTIQNENVQNQMNQKAVPFDTLAMNTACYEALKAAVECDKYDVLPNEKGKVKIRFRQANQQRMQNVRLNLINAGLYDYNHKNLDGALAKWALYLESPASDLFTGLAAVSDVAQDQYRSEIAINAENKMAWALRGEALMNARDWDPAVEAYKKALEIDPTFIQCVFNAGVCLNGKAIDLKDKLADKNTGGLTKANADKVKAILHDAREFLERAKELDPDREKVNWAYPLYQIYYSIGDKAKSDEMEKLVNAGK